MKYSQVNDWAIEGNSIKFFIDGILVDEMHIGDILGEWFNEHRNEDIIRPLRLQKNLGGAI